MTPRVKGPRRSPDGQGDGRGNGHGDGRSSRWSAHRESRRTALVEAAVAAIDGHGPDASVADIAAVAGVSKPVLYRYFEDKAELHAAVGTWGAHLVLARLAPALEAPLPIEQRVRAGVDAYLSTIDEHPNVFLLLVRNRAEGQHDPLADGKAAIASALARVMGDTLRAIGVDAAGAEPWAHGLVGLGLATGEWWLTRRTMSRNAVSDYLTAFIWHAFAGITGSYGVSVTGEGALHLVSGDGRDDRHRKEGSR